MKKVLGIILSCFIIISFVGCGNKSSSVTSTNTLEKEKGWTKTVGNTTGSDWIEMTDYQKQDIVKKVINSWESNGEEIVKSSDWFINNLDDFYADNTLNMDLAKAMSLIAATGKACKKDQEKVEKTMSTISTNEEVIWQYCMDRWKYYDSIEGGYSGDKHTQDVFNDAASNFDISASEAKRIWGKVDRAKAGLDY